MAAFRGICWHGVTVGASIWYILYKAARKSYFEGAIIWDIFFSRILCPPRQTYYSLLDQHLYSSQSPSNHIVVKVLKPIQSLAINLVSIQLLLQFRHPAWSDARTDGASNHYSPNADQFVWDSAWKHAIIGHILNVRPVDPAMHHFCDAGPVWVWSRDKDQIP